jgi:hypothetical protein
MGNGPLHLRRPQQPAEFLKEAEGLLPMDYNAIAQRCVASTVGAESRFNEFERFNVGIEAAGVTLAGNEVDPGVRLINVSPLTGSLHNVVALPF